MSLVVMRVRAPHIRLARAIALVSLLIPATHAFANDEQTAPPTAAAPPAEATQTSTTSVTCASKIGDRRECPADTSKGIVLARSYGEAACLLGKTWGYDDRNVWVADGCVADFLVAGPATATAPSEPKQGAPRYVPNAGFLIVEHDLGE